jgi:hypothetical protein
MPKNYTLLPNEEGKNQDASIPPGAGSFLSEDEKPKDCGTFWNFCHECAGTSWEEFKERPKDYNTKLIKAGAETLTVAAYAYGFDWFIHDKFCDFIFNCGCTWIFTHNWEFCNYHNETGPKCPWCVAGPSIAWTTTYFVQFCMVVSFIYYLYKHQEDMRFCCFNVESESKKRLVRMIVAPTITYFTVATFVGFIFVIFNPHYSFFIIDWS